MQVELLLSIYKLNVVFIDKQKRGYNPSKLFLG